MDAAPPAGWLERVAESLCAHEDRRDTLLNFPPRYEVLDEISRGGMGIVYRAWDPQLGRNVALKVLRTEDGAAAEAHERFQREARLAASLHHPHIVPIYDTGTWNGQDYIAMQLIDGQTLEQARPDRRTALACIRNAARALQYAHEQGIVHRDIKPSNLMLDAQRRLYIMDFGIARQAVSTSGMTSPGTVVGTPAYMSPEQAQGLPLDARSDVYSLGATLYELVTGRAPYQGEPLEVVEAVRTKDPDSARRLVGDLSKNVAAIIAGAMERRAQDRYPTAAALADDIDRYLAGERPTRRPRGLSYKVQREFVRHPWRSAATIMFCILLFGAGVLGGYFIRAWVYRDKAKQAKAIGDKEHELEYLAIAAPFFLDAEEELIHLRAEIEAVAKAPPEPKKPGPDPVPPSPSDQPLKPPPPELPQPDPIETRVKEIEDNLTKDQLVEAANNIEGLERIAPERAAALRTKLWKLRLDSGIRNLEKSASNVLVPEFDVHFAELQNPTYTEQKSVPVLLGPLAFQRALAFGNAKKWKEAVGWFDEAEKLTYKEPELYVRRGLALLELSDWIRAENDLHSLRGFSTTIPPQFAVLPFRREHQALLDKKWSEAMDLADVVFLIDPNYALAYHDRGLARFGRTGRAQDCLEVDLRKALQLDPSLMVDNQYRTVLLKYCRTQGESFWNVEGATKRDEAWQQTIGWLNRLIGTGFSGDPDLLLERAVVRRRKGDLPGALQDAGLAMKARPDGSAHLMMGILTFLQGRLPKIDDAKTREAISFLNEAVRLSPGDYRPLYWRGICQHDLGEQDLDGAFQDLGEARKLHPGSPLLDLQMAITRVDRIRRDSKPKDWKEAADDAGRAILEADGMSDEDMVAGFYELRRLSRSEAEKLHLKEAHFCRAQAFNQGAEFSRSIDECTIAIRLDPEFRLAYLWRGIAQHLSRNHKEAQEDFRMALKLSTQESERKSAEGWLNLSMKASKR